MTVARSIRRLGARVVPDVLAGRHVGRWVAVVLFAIAVGTVGYVVLLGWSLDDALYMTVISLTTVGYKEVRELDDLGRLWTMIVAIAGVGILFGTIGIVAEAVVAEASSERREARRMRERVAALTGHYIVCGYGRVGSTVCRELTHGGQAVVVIDINPASLETARTDGLPVVEGDATRDETLRAAGIAAARGLVTAIDSDANNVYVTLSARALNPGLFIVARANADGADAKLAQAGADRVVSPYTRAGRQIAELAVRPRVADFLDAALSHRQVAFSIEELDVVAGGTLDGQSVGALEQRGAHILAVVRAEGGFEPNPVADRRVAPGEILIVSGSAETLRILGGRA